ncbi:MULTISPECIES: hypothetical protein [unclassified Sporolactobacillus]|uniref:hypothetical protein n=1 Tax=unclassified Sporolactobacillus TaxID=2628533 RepID=UPI0023688F74|nr:hypothetical protein [Sporolactobacillus sp. CQH2019]MDD9148691.1 hypothetical protein [Sporolactobacillus sp. CQH2019]
MKKNLTCKERVTVIFYYFRRPEPKNVVSLNGRRHFSGVTSARQIRELAVFLSHRLEKIACMTELLQSAHDQWLITAKKDRVIMETESFESHRISELLSGQGYNESDYVLRVDYERKWGLL